MMMLQFFHHGVYHPHGGIHFLAMVIHTPKTTVVGEHHHHHNNNNNNREEEDKG